MPTWKKTIFTNVITRRMTAENRTAEVIILEYPKLTESEAKEILEAINSI